MNRSLLSAVLLLYFNSGTAQVIQWGNGDKIRAVGSSCEIFTDSSKQLTIDSISGDHFRSRFMPSRQSILHFGFNNPVVWLRFDINNVSTDSLFLSFDHAFISSAQLYYLDRANNWQVYASGYSVRLPEKPILDHFQLFPIPITNGVFYVRLTPLIHAIPVYILSQKQWQLHASRQKMTYGIYAGILLFAVIINLFLFIALKKWYFLNYSILVFFYLLTSALVMEGYGIYFFPNVDMMYWYKIVPVLDMPAFLFYCISFFELRRKHNRLYKVALFSSIFFCCYLVCLHFLPILTILLLNQLFALFVFVLGMYIGITAGKHGNKLGYLFAISYAIWFILISIEAIYIQMGTPRHITSVSYVSIAIFVEAFLLAFIQAKRFQWEKKADHLRQFELNATMEKMEENYQKEMLTTKLEIQEQTFNTVSQEIHDNVGQLLSLAKIQVNIIQEQPVKDKVILGELNENLTQAMKDLRNIAKGLSDHYVFSNTLTESLHNQVERVNRLGLVRINFSIVGEEKDIDKQKKLVLYRIAQECIQNIIKHAKASLVDIVLDYEQPTFQLCISDNGIGFSSDQLPLNTQGSGLANVRTRAALINGKATITSELHAGTAITINIPYD